MTESISAAPAESASTRRECAPGDARGCRELVVDPRVRPLHALRERGARLPVEPLLDARVVGVPTADALRRIEVVAAVQPNPGDLLDDVDQLVDRHELGGAEVDRVDDVARHDPGGPEQAV